MHLLFSMKTPLLLYPFRFFDASRAPMDTRIWYVAELHIISERYAQSEIIGPAEIDQVSVVRRPHRQPRPPRLVRSRSAC